MKAKSCLRALCVLGAFTHVSAALAVIDANAPVVKLRDPANGGCTEAGVVIHNCFTTGSSLRSWIGTIRRPTISGSLLVDIGPGTFTGFGGGLNPCNISFRGSGRQLTILDRGAQAYALSGNATCNTDFSDLTFRSHGGLGGINLNAVDGVITTWSNVEIDSTAYGWTESGCSNGKHYWFNSRITTRTGFGIARAYSSCSENWFFGSEISAIGTQGKNVHEIFAIGLDGSQPHETHVYGSVIRAIAESGVALPNAMVHPGGKVVAGLVAVSVGSGNSLHIHGTGIDALSSEANHIAVLGAGGEDSRLHVDASAYNLSTGSGGTVARILNPSGLGHVHAPYQWSGHATPPNITSQDGADTAVVTSETGGTPRLVIYSTACLSKWFDVGSNACRP